MFIVAVIIPLAIIIWLSVRVSPEEQMRRDLERRQSSEPDEDEYDDCGLRRPLEERRHRKGLREEE